MSGKKPGDELRIWVMNADGSDPRPLTPGTYEAQYPAWSPDGETIAFAAVIEGGFRLMVMNADGSHIRQLTKGPRDNWPSWSPDGSQIAYGSDGSNPRIITSELGVPATWTPGEVIAANCLVDGRVMGICAVGQDGTLTPLLSGMEAGFPAWQPTR
jgi:dipeptidyl aminopeptidase/acylaminoacyl peptidase